MGDSSDAIWMGVGLVSALLAGLGLLLFAFGEGLRHAAVTVAVSARKTPVRASLATLALGALVSYAGTKPATTYTVEFDGLPLAAKPVESLQCATNAVYNLPAVSGYRWRSSANDRLYDGGILFFNLALPGETVKMTAVSE